MTEDEARRTAEANMQLARANIAAYNAGDLDRFMESIAPDVEVFPDASVFPEPGPLRGREEYRRWLEDIGSAWTDVRWEIVEQFPVGEDRVVQRGEWGGEGTASGIRTTSSITGVSTVRGGKITRVEFYFDHDEGLKAAVLDG
jgi:ketosteroid isomerase-like protein